MFTACSFKRTALFRLIVKLKVTSAVSVIRTSRQYYRSILIQKSLIIKKDTAPPIDSSDQLSSVFPSEQRDMRTFQILIIFPSTKSEFPQIPVIKRAEAVGGRALRLFASPWTAPKWMKTNNDFVGYGQLRQDMYQPWAEYFVRFLDEYAAQGITFWGLTAQNEPIDGYVPGFFFNCMGWTAEEQRKWVAENLGPTLLQHGYGDVKLMILDDQRYQLPGWAENVLNDPEAAQYVSGIGVHWYGDTYTVPERLTQTHDLFPDYFILGTEACEGATPLEVDVALGKWERLESYAHDIIVDMNHWVTGWVDWNLALDMQGGPNWASNFVDAPIIVNKEADEFYKNPMFYAMGHFSKFVKEGATKLGLSSEDQKKLEATAFRNPDGSTAVVILNRSKDDKGLVLEVEGRGSLNLDVPHESLHTVLFV